MQASPVFAAVDLGAESGKVLSCAMVGDRLEVAEVHRFPNRPVHLVGTLHWNVLELHQGILDGLRKAASHGNRVRSVAVDTWGLDFGLVGPSGQLLANPVHYRDRRAAAVISDVQSIISPREIFAETGIQFMPVNTIYHLYAAFKSTPELTRAAEVLLMMGELFTYFLSGEKVAEITNASTTQVYNPISRTWSDRICTALGIRTSLLPELRDPGQIVGKLLPDVRETVGGSDISVVLPAVHDTASAVVAVPADSSQGAKWGYISSGTWSLVGVELLEPCITDDAFKYNFTNEVGACGTIRFLKNVMGLWLIQQCRQAWIREGNEVTYEEIATLAASTPDEVAIIDPDHSEFLYPGHMPERIREYCRRTDQRTPEGIGAFARCIFLSLALKYRYVFERIKETCGYEPDVIHIVGGGSKNRLLNQLTADATGKLVIAGPVEGTGVGNALMQLMAHGEISNLEQGRALVKRSFRLDRYEPSRSTFVDEAYHRLLRLIEA